MKIQIAEHFGMCFGVRDALAEAERLAGEGPLTILGELVHNPVVRERLAGKGVKEGALGEEGSAKSKQVMITAHGASDRARARWKELGYEVADATCPLVQHAHAQLRKLVGLGYFPVVIGKAGHAEVNGLVGDFPEAVVVENEEGIAKLPEGRPLGVISQTTQPIERVHKLVHAMRSREPGREVKFCDTVCQPTKNRQRALGKLLAECDTIVVVGGRNSNNTLELVAVARQAGLAVVHVERAQELEIGAFRQSEMVGITAGTSTLKETVEAVHARLLELVASREPSGLLDQSDLLETGQLRRSTGVAGGVGSAGHV